MQSFSRSQQTPAPAVELLRRKPQRVSITLGWAVHQRLQQQALEQGRSVSNLAALYLELASSGLLPQIPIGTASRAGRFPG